SGLSGIGTALVVRSGGSQAVYFLKSAALFPPHVVDLHGGLTLSGQIQILLRQ
ncbi:hypothetical protein M9458_049162, partial [Cirrhinus mrigala]